jgi:CRP/FNR family transcriptional regulator, dissimilatory nitrate respiration regulator
MRSTNRLILGQSRLFRGLDEQVLEKIAEHTTIRSFKKGEHLFYQDDVAHAFYTIIEGWISVYRVATEGEQVIMHVFRDGEAFAGPAAFSFGYYPASAMAETNCTVLEINVTSIKSVLADSPDMSMNIINSLSLRLIDMVNEIEKLHTRTAPLRLAEFILELCPENSEEAFISLPFSKHCLAARLKLQPESLSRAFTSLKQYGVKTDRGTKITVENIGKLQDLVGVT